MTYYTRPDVAAAVWQKQQTKAGFMPYNHRQQTKFHKDTVSKSQSVVDQ